MKIQTIKKNLLGIIFLGFLVTLNVEAQELPENSKRPYKSQTYFSFGAGVSFLQGVPDNFYQDGQSNVQIGMMKELPFNKRLSFVMGL